MSNLYRFELAFDGELQDIGIFCGLDEIDLPEGIRQNIENDFNMLTCPHLSETASFWLTEHGLQALQYTIDYLIEHSRKLNWQLLYAKISDAYMSKALYVDGAQVAFPAKMIKHLQPQYREFGTVSDLMKDNNLHKAFLTPFDLYVYNVKSALNAPDIVVASDGTVNGEYPLEAMAQFFKVGKVIDIHVDEVFYDAVLITYEESASAT